MRSRTISTDRGTPAGVAAATQMTSAPDITIVVCTYERPRNLSLCLDSIAAQEGVDGRLEVVVADDGSADGTAALVEAFRARAPFPVRFTTHEHRGFHPARCRNEGARAGTAPYLLFLDGDCVIPPGHVRAHLAERREGTVCGSDSFRLTEADSMDAERHPGDFERLARLVSRRERMRVGRDHLDARLNWLLRNPSKPKLFSGNLGVWRRDFERVNGFDEKFHGWGGEDDDFRLRLIQARLGIRSIRDRARSFHLWHPPDSSAPRKWNEGRNTPFLQRPWRLTRCVDGLTKRSMDDLSIRLVNAERFEPLVASLVPCARNLAPPGAHADVECVFAPGPGGFTGSADCRILVVTEHGSRLPLRDAHILVTDLDGVRFDRGPRFTTRDSESLRATIP